MKTKSKIENGTITKAMSRLSGKGPWSYRLVKGLLGMLLRVVFRVKAKGWERLPKEGGVLMICNHLSYTDALILFGTCPRAVRMMGSSGLQQSRFLAWLFRKFGVIPVSPKEALDVVRRGSKALREGDVVVIFPEGSVSVSGDLMPLQKGFQSIAKYGQAPILAAHLSYESEARLMVGDRYLRNRYPKLRPMRGAVLQIGTMIYPEELTMDKAREAIVDAGYAAFEQREELQGNLGVLAVKGLKRTVWRKQFVDLATGRKELRAGMLLAVGLTMKRAWGDRIKGERVGVVLPSGLGSVLVNLVITLMGKTPVNLNFTAGRTVNEYCMELAEIETVISARPVMEKLRDFPWPEKTIDLVKERASIQKKTILWNFLKVVLMPSGMLMRHFEISEKGGEREAAILFSSGSTGIPKGVVLTHRNIVANCLQFERCGLLNRDEKLLASLPTFHSFGFTATLWFPLITGIKVVYMPSPLETKRIAEAVRDEGVTILVGTPTFYRPYLKRVPREWLKGLKLVIGGAEKTPEGFIEKWESHFGNCYLEAYGLTECSPGLSANLPRSKDGRLNKRAGSVGRLFEGIKARVTDPVSGELLTMGTTGMLEVQGANVFRGYLKDLESTEACFREDWFVTGDLARIDADGFLYIEGRLSRFSKIGGEMVPHGAIEEAIVRMFDLGESEVPLVAVGGIRDEQKGEAVVLLTAIDMDAATLRRRLSEGGLPNLWIPRKIIRVAQIPCLATGKLDLKTVVSIAEGLSMD